MGRKRRDWIIWSYCLVNQRLEEPGNKIKLLGLARRLDDKSRMAGDCHVRIRGSVGVKLPCATQLLVFQKMHGYLLVGAVGGFV